MVEKVTPTTVDHKSVIVRTPGKLILSGEHAVVYGNPALAMAINRYTETKISYHPTQTDIVFNLLNFNYSQTAHLSALRLLKRKVEDNYQQFLKDQRDIRLVLQEPSALLQYAVIRFLDDHQIDLNQVEICVHSNILLGSGMGSSAAAAVGIIQGLAHYVGLKMDTASCYQLAWQVENMQHGHSSGLDVYLVLQGGCVRFQKDGLKEARPIPQRSFLLVNTGAPETTTGQCVSATAAHLKNNPQLLAEFAQVTERMDQALQQNDTSLLLNSVRDNHRLLVKIGVAPAKVQRFIAQVEQMGGAAKICGAGSIQGESAGVVLVVTDNDLSELVRDYHYQCMPIQGETQGTHVI